MVVLAVYQHGLVELLLVILLAVRAGMVEVVEGRVLEMVAMENMAEAVGLATMVALEAHLYLVLAVAVQF